MALETSQSKVVRLAAMERNTCAIFWGEISGEKTLGIAYRGETLAFTPFAVKILSVSQAEIFYVKILFYVKWPKNLF